MAVDSEIGADRAAPPEKRELGIEVGVDTSYPFALPFNPYTDGADIAPGEKLYQVPNGTNPKLPSIEQLIKMRKTDPQARGLYSILTKPLRGALNNATFIAAPDGDAEAAFITAMFTMPHHAGGMSTSFATIIKQILLALSDGFAAFEKVFDYAETGPMAGKYVLRKLAYRPAETITFLTQEDGSFGGFRQLATLNGKLIDRRIPTDRAFYYAAQEEERKFYGVSYFETAYSAYRAKQNFYYLMQQQAQRVAVPLRKGKMPNNAGITEEAEFKAALKRIAFAQTVALPDGFDIDVVREQGSFDFLNIINHYSSQMSKSILANFFDKDQGTAPGAGPLVDFAQPGDDMFILTLRSIMDEIAAAINTYIIPQLIDFNFAGGKYPTFTWGRFTDAQKEVISETFRALMATAEGAPTPEFKMALEQQFTKELNLDVDYAAVEKRLQEEQAAADQAAKQQAETAKQQADAAAQAAADGQPPVEDGTGQPGAAQKPPQSRTTGAAASAAGATPPAAASAGVSGNG